MEIQQSHSDSNYSKLVASFPITIGKYLIKQPKERFVLAPSFRDINPLRQGGHNRAYNFLPWQPASRGNGILEGGQGKTQHKGLT